LRSHRSLTRPALVLALLGVTCLLTAGPASAAGTVTATLTFKEPEKGSTFTYVDVAPTAPKKHGFPTAISPGDQLVLTNPLTEGSKTIGKLRAKCTATSAAKTTSNTAFLQAHFICEGVFTLPGGTLYANASIVKGGTEGAITGGTGKYAGASGTILSKEVKGGSTTTITLLE
jgi:Dirigent-like protein